MKRQSKRVTMAAALLVAVGFAAGLSVGQGPERAEAGVGPIQQAQYKLKKIPKGALTLFKCAATFVSNPGSIKTSPPNQTKSYLCTANIPHCAKYYYRSTGQYGTADNTFRFVCAIQARCVKGYNLVAHQQSASKFQYRCELATAPPK